MLIVKDKNFSDWESKSASTQIDCLLVRQIDKYIIFHRFISTSFSLITVMYNFHNQLRHFLLIIADRPLKAKKKIISILKNKLIKINI